MALYSDEEVHSMVARCAARDRFICQRTSWAPEGGPANVTRAYHQGPLGLYCLCWERSADDTVVQVWREEPDASFDPTHWPG